MTSDVAGDWDSSLIVRIRSLTGCFEDAIVFATRAVWPQRKQAALSRRSECSSVAGGLVAKAIKRISYSVPRFPPEIIHRAIWLYLRFTLSLRDVEDLLAERGIAVSYESVRRWVNHFGLMIAADLRKRRPRPHTTWHLDEVYLKIDGRLVYLWRAVDAEGEILDVLVQAKRDKHAALNLFFGMIGSFPSYSLTTLGSKKPGQVKDAPLTSPENRAPP